VSNGRLAGSVPGYEERAVGRGGSVTGYADVGRSIAPLETTHLRLRQLVPHDLDELRPSAREGDFGHWAHGGADGAASWLRAAVTERSTGRLLGAAEVCADPCRAAVVRLEIWISGPARGRGHGGDVAAALSAWAFRHGAARVELLARTDDVAAQRMALAAGFRREGHLRGAIAEGLTRADAVLFGRLAADSALPGRRLLPDVGELTDGVVVVRPVRPGDEPALLDERLDPDSRRWATTTRLWTAADVRLFVAGSATAWLAGTEARFAIVDAGSGECAGSLGLRMTIPAFRIAEIGYGLRAQWRGLGLATRAVRLVSDWTFTRAGVSRLELGAAVTNEASQRVAVRAGFRLEGIARMRLPTSDGGRTDEARFSLLPPD
jgi:RimJ/RimL family protein N-acetyltransferase